uniref:Uncharacterized protein n=1 Tax=Solanum tuberosum TaxID=4113 RepID=M1DFG8_SOLTU
MGFSGRTIFTRYKILFDRKLSLASLYLDGDALNCYCWLFRNKQLADWDYFVVKLFIRFQTRSQEALDRRLAFFHQLTTIDYCPEGTTTIPSWNTIANSPSPQYYQTFAHKVFGEKTDKKTENVVNVEAMLQTPDSMKQKREMQPATLAAMSPEWKVLKLRSNYKSKLQVVHPIDYTFYSVIEMVELVVRHILRLGLVAMQRFGGERASNVVHQHFKEDNFSLDGSDHVKQYFLYQISSAFGASS